MTGKHRASSLTPVRFLLGEIALIAGRRGVSHRK